MLNQNVIFLTWTSISESVSLEIYSTLIWLFCDRNSSSGLNFLKSSKLIRTLFYSCQFKLLNSGTESGPKQMYDQDFYQLAFKDLSSILLCFTEVPSMPSLSNRNGLKNKNLNLSLSPGLTSFIKNLQIKYLAFIYQLVMIIYPFRLVIQNSIRSFLNYELNLSNDEILRLIEGLYFYCNGVISYNTIFIFVMMKFTSIVGD